MDTLLTTTVAALALGFRFGGQACREWLAFFRELQDFRDR